MVLYEHLDKNNEVFYVGIGSIERPKTKHGRNKYWHEIVNDGGYTIKVIKKDLKYEEACEEEKKLISFYGRRNIGTGNLINLTSGGSGTLGRVFTEEHKKKLTNAQIGDLNHRFGKVGVNKGKKRGNHPTSKKIINTKTNQIYGCIQDAADSVGLSYDNLRSRLRRKVVNNTNLEYFKN